MEPGEIHLWTAGLDVEDSSIASFHATLSADEAERAGRFLAELDRRRFNPPRGIFRRLLGPNIRK